MTPFDYVNDSLSQVIRNLRYEADEHASPEVKAAFEIAIQIVQEELVFQRIGAEVDAMSEDEMKDLLRSHGYTDAQMEEMSQKAAAKWADVVVGSQSKQEASS